MKKIGKELYVCYIDFRKAFDSVWKKGLWRVMRHYGYREKIVRILENIYSETLSAVRVGGDLTEWFQTECCRCVTRRHSVPTSVADISGNNYRCVCGRY